MADTEQKPEETPAAEEPKKTIEDKPVENGDEKAVETVADGETPKTEEEGAKEEPKAEENAVENHENGDEGDAEGGEGEAEEETPPPSLEAPTENPFTDEDVQQLLDLESGEEGWDKVKEKKGAVIYKKSEKNSVPLIKGVLEYTGIPTEKVLEFYTDFEVRKKWNKKTVNIDVLEERDDFQIIHSVFKMPTGCDNRDAVQCHMVKSEEDGSRHVLLYKSCNHPNKPPKKSSPLRADVQLMGAVIRPKEGEEGVTTVTFFTQTNLKGWMPKAIVNKIIVGFPVALYDDLTLYWKKITEPPKSPEKKEKKNKEKAAEENGEAAAGEEGDKKEEEKKDGEEEAKEADVTTEKKEEGGEAASTEAAAEGTPVGEGESGKLDTKDIPDADDEEAK